MEHELFPDEYDTHKQFELAHEYADGYEAGYAQAEKELMREIRELQLIIMDLEDVVENLLAKRN